VCGPSWASSTCWSGTWEGDHRSFVVVVKSGQAPIVMVHPRRPRGWGHTGFGSEKVGRGAGHTGHQGMTWYRQDW
jgi:hypothetical protein